MPAVTRILNAVHALLGQDPASSSNYVTNDELDLFARMAQRLLCTHARAFPLIGTKSLTSGTGVFTLSTFTPYRVETLAQTTVSHVVSSIEDIILVTDGAPSPISTGESLKQIEQPTDGQVFYDGTGRPIFYSTHENRVLKLYPTPTIPSGQSWGLVMRYTGIITAQTALTDDTYWYLGPEWDDLVILYCTGKGKEKYQQFEQAQYYINQFATSIGLSREEVKNA